MVSEANLAPVPVELGPDVVLYEASAFTVLPGMRAESVAAIVTSPPYADARPDVPAPPLDHFAAWIAPALAELLRVVTPTGSLMLNLGRRFRDGEEHGYAIDTLTVAKEIGWRHIDTIVWCKTNGNARGGPYLHDRHEYVYWLAARTDAYRGYDETRQPYAPSTIPRMGRAPRAMQKGAAPQPSRPPHPDGARPSSVFSCSIGREAGNPHPTPMALDLAKHLVALACPPSGTVLDPFAGSGNTALAARALGRRAILIELEEQWCRVAADRLGQLPLLGLGS